MYQYACVSLVSLALLAGATRSTPHPDVRAAHGSARAAAPAAAQSGAAGRIGGLVLTGEMLFGGIVLIGGSAYALRRSRR